MMLTLLAVISAAEAEPTPPPIGVTPWPVRRDAVEVHFLAYEGDEEYTVKVGSQSCKTPCTLVLKPGPTRVQAEGTGDVDAQLVVPHLTAQVRLKHVAPRWYTPTGAALVPLGAVVAASLWAIALTCGPFSGACTGINIVTWPIVGVSMVVTGAVLLGLGARSAPLDANRTEILDAARGVRFRGFALAPVPGGLAGGLGFTF